MLFAKTLVRKDIASSAASVSDDDAKKQKSATTDAGTEDSENIEEEDFASKAQIMTLMTTDVDRVSEFSWHVFTLVGKPKIFRCQNHSEQFDHRCTRRTYCRHDFLVQPPRQVSCLRYFALTANLFMQASLASMV